jgi:hypothetical protein
VGWVTRWLSVREVRALRKKHRTEATEGELEGGSGLGDMVAFSARSARASEKASHRGHGGHKGELERGTWRSGSLCPESALFSPDHDLHAAVELLLVH